MDGSTGWVSRKFSRIATAGAGAVPSLPENETVKVSPAPAAPPATSTMVVIRLKKGSRLNVRSLPSSQGQVVGSLEGGEMRPLLEESGEWYKVEYRDGQSGWVSQKFSAKLEPE